MNFQLITLAGVKVDQEIYSATIPTVDGQISVFPSHETLVTLAEAGIIGVAYHKEEELSEFFAISGGIVEISHNYISVLVDEAEHGDDIIEAESKEALRRAMQIRDESPDQVAREKAHQLVNRQLVRLKVAELQRRRRR